MKITHKLILSFWLILISVWAASYYSITTAQKKYESLITQQDTLLASEFSYFISHLIYSRLETFQEYGNDVLLQKALEESNGFFEKIPDIDAYMADMDSRWAAGDNDPAASDLYKKIIDNDLSEELREKKEYYEKKYEYDIYSEIIATNKYGAVAGCTGKTTDYRQGDEQWWQKAESQGQYIQDISYDESTDTMGLHLSVRVTDEEGNFLGVLKTVYTLDETLHLLASAGKTELNQVPVGSLMTRDGRVIYSSDPFYTFLENGTETIYYRKAIEPQGFFSSDDGEKFYVYAQLPDYREMKGLGWVLVIENDTAEIFAPVDQLKKKLTLFALCATVLILGLSLFTIRIISGPLNKMKEAALAFGRGEMDTRIDISTSDEIGQVAAAFNTMSKDLQKTTVSRDILVKEEKEKEKLIGELQEALKEVKTLSGIIPICMHCKQIRDDKGYWNKLEQFVAEHSEVRFSHSICDKCVQDHYPELAEKIKKEIEEDSEIPSDGVISS